MIGNFLVEKVVSLSNIHYVELLSSFFLSYCVWIVGYITMQYS